MPRRALVFTVPSGMLSWSAICELDRPRSTASSITFRSSGLSCSSCSRARAASSWKATGSLAGGVGGSTAGVSAVVSIAAAELAAAVDQSAASDHRDERDFRGDALVEARGTVPEVDEDFLHGILGIGLVGRLPPCERPNQAPVAGEAFVDGSSSAGGHLGKNTTPTSIGGRGGLWTKKEGPAAGPSGSCWPQSYCIVFRPANYGISTWSMTWITPFDWWTSAMVIAARLPLSS